MGDRTNVSITIRKCDFEYLVRELGKGKKDDFLDLIGGVDQLDEYKRLVTFEASEINYANWESLEKILTERKIQYDKEWGEGDNYSSGVAYFRVIDNKPHLLEQFKESKQLISFLEGAIKIVDDPAKLKDLIKGQYSLEFPFKITPLEQPPPSVQFILKTKKKRKEKS